MSKTIKIEFKNLVQELIDVPSDEREELICDRLDQISPDPNYSDYIFHSNEFSNEDGTFDLEGLVEKVFSYQPICL